MAKVTGLRNWRNGDIINARDYVYERNQVTDALNTNDDTLIDHETRITDLEPLEGNLNAHIANVSNPHSVTKAQVGLSNVDNTTDANKPVSTATQTALNLKANLESPTFTGTVSGITKTMVGLPNVDNTTDANKPISTATQTALDLKADLVDGKVPQNQLPSYVDDILEVYVRAGSTEGTSNWLSLTNGGAALTPEAGKIYVIISAGDFLNKTYRWSGSAYSPVGDIALGTTAATAFPGDRGLATETKTNNIVSGVQGLTDTRITNSAVGVVPLVVNTIPSTTAVLQEWQINGTVNARITNSGYLAGLGLLNLSNSNNGSIVMLNAGTSISRNIADTNPALIVNLANASATGNIQTWQKNGSALAWINQNGVFFSTNVINPTSTNNSRIDLNDTGSVIRRNIADANPALIVNQVDASSTGDITRFQFGGANKLEVTKDGFLNQNGTRLFTQPAGITNTFFGNTSGGTATTGINNTGFGEGALKVLTSGQANIAVGKNALASLTTSNESIAIGVSAGSAVGIGSQNTVVGSYGLGITTGASNTGFGYAAGLTNTSGSNNTFVGHSSGNNASQLATASNSTAIGNGSFTDKSNQMVFGNASVTEFKFDRNASATAIFPILNSAQHVVAGAVSGTSTYTQYKNATTNLAILGSDRAITNTSDGFGIYVYGNNLLELSTNNAKRLVITGNGNVGIGTTAPANLLHIRGTGASGARQLLVASSTDRARLHLLSEQNVPTDIWLGTNNADRWSITARASDENYSFGFYNSAVGFAMFMNGSTNAVGINETSPSAQLQVKSGSTTRIPLIVDTLASHTATLQEWKVNGTTLARIEADGSLRTLEIRNLSAAGNSRFYLNTTGSVIERNVADANPALITNLVNASSTGDILKLQKAGTTLASVANNGDIYAPRFIANPSSGGSDTAGAWGISDYDDKLSAVRDYITDTYYPIYHSGNKPGVADISATGTPDATTFLRGDGTWANPDVFSYASLATSTSRQDTTYTTFLTSPTLDANSRYEVEVSVIFYKTSTAASRNIEYNIIVNNTTGTPTLQLVGEHSNIGTGSGGMNFYVASTTAATGTTHTTLPSQTGAYTRIFNLKGIVYTGTSTKTISIQDRASATLTGGENVGSGAGSYIKVRKIM